MRKQNDERSRKSSTTSQRSGTSGKILKVLIAIMLLAGFKLGLIFSLGLGLAPGSLRPDIHTLADTEAEAAAADQSGAKQAASGQQQPQPPQQTPQGQQPAQQKPQAAPPAKDDKSSQPADWNALRAKEEELNRKEQSLAALEQELNARMTKLQELDAQIRKMIDDAKVIKDQKLMKLVEVYSNMKAKQAAQVLETLDTDIAVRILAEMKGRQAGEILSYVNAQKAAKLSEALTKLQMPPQVPAAN